MTLRSSVGLYHSLLLFRLSTASHIPDEEPKELSDQGHVESVNNRISEDIAEQLYVMESACPHLGADMSHADIEECETGMVAVCPWHRYSLLSFLNL